jgi:hypothetical protein
MDLRQTDECDKFYPTWLLDGCDAGRAAVGGEALNCDRQTNAINSPWLL